MTEGDDIIRRNRGHVDDLLASAAIGMDALALLEKANHRIAELELLLTWLLENVDHLPQYLTPDGNIIEAPEVADARNLLKAHGK